MSFDQNPFTCQRENEDKKAEGFQILQFCGSFSNDIMAAKGLSEKFSVEKILCTLLRTLYGSCTMKTAKVHSATSWLQYSGGDILIQRLSCA